MTLAETVLTSEPVAARDADPAHRLHEPSVPLPLDLSGLGPEMARLVAGHPRWVNPVPRRPIYTAALDGAAVVGHRNAVLTRDGRPVAESLYLQEPRHVASALRDGTFSESGEDAFLIANAVYWNYFHWTLQCLPSLLLLPSEGEHAIVVPELNAWQRRSLELAGHAHRALTHLDRRETRRFRSVVFPSMLVADGLHASLRPFYERIRDRVPAATGAGRLLYVSRSDSEKRRLLNEAELASAMADLGFDVVVPGERSLDEQIALFASARLIVGPHGGGLTNLVYARPGTVLYELHAAHYLESCYCRLAHVFGLGYRADCFAPVTGDATRHSTPWTVDVAAVVERVEALLRA